MISMRRLTYYSFIFYGSLSLNHSRTRLIDLYRVTIGVQKMLCCSCVFVVVLLDDLLELANLAISCIQFDR